MPTVAAAPAQAAFVPVVDSPAMTEHARGKAHRRTILAELLRREREGLPSPTNRELAHLLGIPLQGTQHHLAVLKERLLLTWEPGLARTLRLTDEGRAALKPPADCG